MVLSVTVTVTECHGWPGQVLGPEGLSRCSVTINKEVEHDVTLLVTPACDRVYAYNLNPKAY
eukprot:769817-Rhodomonas_salina.3